MNEPVIIPAIVAKRWQEALAAPTLRRWSSLTHMLSDMVVNASVYAPGAPMVDDLRTLAHVAHMHQIELQPQIAEAA